MLKNFPVFLIVFSGLLSVKRAVVHNEIETALEVLCSSKLNFQFLEMDFQNERTVRYRRAFEAMIRYLGGNAKRAHPQRDARTGRSQLGLKPVFALTDPKAFMDSREERVAA